MALRYKPESVKQNEILNEVQNNWLRYENSLANWIKSKIINQILK